MPADTPPSLAASPLAVLSNGAEKCSTTLERIAQALERLAPPPPSLPTDLSTADAFLWQATSGVLEPVVTVNRVDLGLLQGIDRQQAILLDNTRRFARDLPANDALLWGARGTGKSALVKAVHATVSRESPLVLVEIHREDIPTLPGLLTLLASSQHRYLLFCDDLSFESGDQSYKPLKAMLDGGIQGRPRTVLFYATSNRRHLIPRDVLENEQANALIAGETMEEKVALSDRFGLWLGFHAIDQATYLDIVHGYAQAFALPVTQAQLVTEAKEWSVTRGARSGRVAWQFIQDLAGRLGCRFTRT
ncbi:ATP-DEPENDENT PROTEASE SUBUNIT [invertebrate metagenome]|uniref:ATP-DEPENDENT PROTEASE SUBUNIT n=1 Tax=invertebrate metagenome TaxID=1711999 RepID=A0A484H8K9_9ZZZZ